MLQSQRIRRFSEPGGNSIRDDPVVGGEISLFAGGEPYSLRADVQYGKNGRWRAAWNRGRYRMAKKKSGVTFSTPDGAGGMRVVSDHRFDPDQWTIKTTIPASKSEEYMAHLNAAAETRGWSISGLGQLNQHESTGSLTLHVVTGQSNESIYISWGKARGGSLSILARATQIGAATDQVAVEFFGEVDSRLRSGKTESTHRRYWLMYDGLPWKGELWLNDRLRLGPPSRFPDTVFGPQAVIVDAMVNGIGRAGIQGEFHRILRDIRLILSPILGIHLERAQWLQTWVPEIDTMNQITGCRIQPVGYTEIGAITGFPVRGSEPAISLEQITRPGLGTYGIEIGETELQVPADIEQLWQKFNRLSPELKTQFRGACNAYSLAQPMWHTDRTSFVLYLVVACEALKPAGRQYDKLNIYDVVATFAGTQTAIDLRDLNISPQSVRSKHVHRGILAEDIYSDISLNDPFADPTFDSMVRMLAQLTRICLIEWLRARGSPRFVRLPRPQTGTRPRRRRGGATSKTIVRRKRQAAR